MKKITLLTLLLFAIIGMQAQDYLISFAGTGASSTIETVTVENLSQGKSITLNGTEVLHLVASITGINPITDNVSELRIYPNPTNGNSTIDFVATASGKVTIELFDITGKRLGTANNILKTGTHSYQVNNLRSGIYSLRIASQSYNYTAKLVSIGATKSEVTISYIGNGIIPDSSMKLKSANAVKQMQYTTGDRLKLTGISDIYSTVIVDVPTQGKTIPFKFVACTDADGNNYPVVQIGTQIWMAENLKTVKYRNGNYIPQVVGLLKWRNLVTGAYTWYNDDINNKLYGALYNYYATSDSRSIAPVGWHVATFLEWKKLASFLGDSVGTKLKATGNSWIFNYLTSNESGFSALPGGSHWASGAFSGIRESANWWSPSEVLGKESSIIRIDSHGTGMSLVNESYDPRIGNSVRCIMD